jgi:GNAT superfamily N-acetyltransferase
MSVRIRLATAADIPDMHRIRRRVRENRLSIHTKIDEAAYNPFVAAGSIWVAERDDRVRGFAAIDLETASVWALFVDPQDEGAGLGRALHRTMLDQARQRGLLQLSLSTQSSSRASRFYERGGWRRMRTDDGESFYKKVLP